MVRRVYVYLKTKGDTPVRSCTHLILSAFLLEIRLWQVSQNHNKSKLRLGYTYIFVFVVETSRGLAFISHSPTLVESNVAATPSLWFASHMTASKRWPKSPKPWNRPLDQVCYLLKAGLEVTVVTSGCLILKCVSSFLLLLDTNDLAMRFGLNSGPVTAGKSQINGKLQRTMQTHNSVF